MTRTPSPRSWARRGARLRDGPTRTCIGCGRKAPKSSLVRFVAPAGELSRDDEQVVLGRGAYTCRRRACFELAASRRAFARTLRQTVRIPPDFWTAEL